MANQLYAHSHPEKLSPEDWQPLSDHLQQVAQLASDFADTFSSSHWAWNAGLLHDIGKAAPEFQKYLLNQNGLNDAQYDSVDSGGINHSSAGAALVERCFPDFSGRTLAFLVAGHHAGLTDYEAAEVGHGALTCRLKEGAVNLKDIYDAADVIRANLKPVSRPPAHVKPCGFHLWVRMLFSCLTDADFLDTEEFMQTDKATVRAQYPTLSALKTPFDRFMANLAKDSEKTPVNSIRKEILAASRAAAQEPPGFFSMNVPTGGGKTLAAMAFALDHAIRHDKKRIIYVIPYTSIIEQTADVLANIFGRENIVEHHSNLDPDKESQSSRLAAENWDAPIVVTTNVQFFESLYAARTGRCRKLHNVVNSVVILDEAQLLPTKWLTPCVNALNHIATDYGVTIVLSTATQPSPPGLKPPREIVPDYKRLHAKLKRTQIHLPSDLKTPTTWETLVDDLALREQVLCIVSARRDCRELYDALCVRMPAETVIHLSALMCGEHRSRTIGAIKQRLIDKLPTRVVSTQLVEAGVDLDFPVVYRALAGLDSIAQAAGRCNREGKLDGLGDVIVFVPPKDPYGLLRKGVDTTRELAAEPCGFDPQDPDAYGRYFKLFYSKANDTGKDWLETRLVKNVPNLSFRTAALEFQLIDDKGQQAVIVLYGESEKLLNSLRAIGPTREIMRRLQRYSVTLPRYLALKMIDQGMLEILDCGIVVQSMPHLYKEEIGLDVYNQRLPVEDLMQ